MVKGVKLAGSLVSIALVLSVSVQATYAVSRLVSSSQDEALLCAQAKDYARAFAAGDAAGLAAMWSDDGTYTDADGREYRSRKEIEKLFAAYFKRFGAQRMKLRIDSLKFPAANIACEEGESSLIGAGSSGGSGYSVVHIKNGGQWKMLSVVERELPEAAPVLSDLSWLVGDWSVSNGAIPAHFRGTWEPGHRFIGFRPTGDGADAQIYQLFGYDPLSSRIVSWHFAPDGGYGSGTWSRDGDTWSEKATSVQPDAKVAHALYIIHRIDDNRFTWRSCNRSIDGRPMSDSQELILIRSAASK